jgi:hypothetical protein
VRPYVAVKHRHQHVRRDRRSDLTDSSIALRTLRHHDQVAPGLRAAGFGIDDADADYIAVIVDLT